MDKWDLAPFKFKLLPPNEVRDEWQRYKRNFEYMALANNLNNKTRLKNIFLARAGPDVQVRSGVLRATEVASKCNFGQSKEEAQDISVIDKVIQLAPPDLREKLLQREHLVMDEVIKLVNSHEAIKFQASQMTSSNIGQPSTSGEINRIRNAPKKLPQRGAEGCSRCGRKGHYGNDKVCPARTKTCDQCGKVGHFAVRCHSSKPVQKNKRAEQDEDYRKRSRFQSQPVRTIEDVEEKGITSSFIFAIGEGDEYLWIAIGGVLV